MADFTALSASPLVKYGPVLDKCRDEAVAYFAQKIRDLYDKSGSVLFDFAERSESTEVRERFEEAVRVVNRERAGVERRFSAQVQGGFQNLSQGGGWTKRRGGVEDTDVELSLVGPEQLEEIIAVEGLQAKYTGKYQTQLQALAARLAFLHRAEGFNLDEIPGGPRLVIQSFRDSIRGLELDARARITLYALFGKLVMDPAKDFYEAYNERLREAGILPHLRPRANPTTDASAPASKKDPIIGPSTVAAPSAAPGAAPVGGGGSQAGNLSEELFDSILELMSAKRGGNRAAPIGPVAPPAEVASTIDQIRARQDQPEYELPKKSPGQPYDPEADQQFVTTIKQNLSAERQRVIQEVGPDRLSPVDSDIIDLIGLLFEYMLNDPALPNVAKALLSHLHTPYLKVAIIDRSLLFNSEHPARLLLDTLVDAGTQWVEENNTEWGIFPSMRRVVDRILEEFRDNTGLFLQLLKEFREAVEEKKRRAEAVEQRARESMAGREKLNLAKRQATLAIERRLEGRPVPRQLSQFLMRSWTFRLMQILMRDPAGESGPEWHQAIAVVDRLIPIFDPFAQPDARDRLNRDLPALRQDIAKDLAAMGGTHGASAKDLFDLLDNPKGWDAAEEVASQMIKRQTAATGEKLVAAATDEAAQAFLSQEEHRAVAKLRSQKFGTWFEFKERDGNAPKRLKLSWFSPLTASCMFMDRSGQNSEVKTIHELARQLVNGQVTIVELPNEPFIQRAMTAIKGMLGRGSAPRGPETAVRF